MAAAAANAEIEAAAAAVAPPPAVEVPKEEEEGMAELMAKGCELQHAQEAVANAERMRLEQVAHGRAQPMVV